MGQYWIVVNLDKREFIHPHRFNDGMKLVEFGHSGMGTLTGLAMLLADKDGIGRGGGDMSVEGPMVGRWFGDRIAIVGDYGDSVEPVYDRNLYQIALGRQPKEGKSTGVLDWAPGGLPGPEPPFKDISEDVVQTLLKSGHDYDRQEFEERFKGRRKD